MHCIARLVELRGSSEENLLRASGFFPSVYLWWLRIDRLLRRDARRAFSESSLSHAHVEPLSEGQSNTVEPEKRDRQLTVVDYFLYFSLLVAVSSLGDRKSPPSIQVSQPCVSHRNSRIWQHCHNPDCIRGFLRICSLSIPVSSWLLCGRTVDGESIGRFESAVCNPRLDIVCCW